MSLDEPDEVFAVSTTEYKVHVFHPVNGKHAGTVSIREQVKSQKLKHVLIPTESRTQLWEWVGGPLGHLRGNFIWGPGTSTREMLLGSANNGPLRIMINDRWKSLAKPPFHPWFKASDTIGMHDQGFRPGERGPTHEAYFKPFWTCKFLSVVTTTKTESVR